MNVGVTVRGGGGVAMERPTRYVGGADHRNSAPSTFSHSPSRDLVTRWLVSGETGHRVCAWRVVSSRCQLVSGEM